VDGIRLVLKDHQWARIEPHLCGKASDRRVPAKDSRRFVEAVLWIVRTSSPWRDLPAAFGSWNSAFRRFSRWSRDGVWWRLFEAMADDPDFEYLIVDSTIVRAHQHSRGLPFSPCGRRGRVYWPASPFLGVAFRRALSTSSGARRSAKVLKSLSPPQGGR
jgi:putative transposase